MIITVGVTDGYKVDPGLLLGSWGKGSCLPGGSWENVLKGSMGISERKQYSGESP